MAGGGGGIWPLFFSSGDESLEIDRLIHFIQPSLTHFSLVLHLIKKPVIRFALQIKCLVSLTNAILG